MRAPPQRRKTAIATRKFSLLALLGLRPFAGVQRRISLSIWSSPSRYCRVGCYRLVPPRRARTRWSVLPPSRLYSAAVLSSALFSPGGVSSLWVCASLRMGWKGGRGVGKMDVLVRTYSGGRQGEDEGRRVYAGWEEGVAYICFPPKMRRCWTGGMPSFSSTRSLIRDTFRRLVSHCRRVHIRDLVMCVLRCRQVVCLGKAQRLLGIWVDGEEAGMEGYFVPCSLARYRVRSLSPLGCGPCSMVS